MVRQPANPPNNKIFQQDLRENEYQSFAKIAMLIALLLN